jgi:hypothetical protein
MLALLQPYFPYVLMMLYMAAQNFIAHNPNIQSNTVEALIVNTIIGALKAAVGSNPPPPPAA